MREQIRAWTEAFETFVLEVIFEERKGKRAVLMRSFLFVLSKIFQVAVKLRRFLYTNLYYHPQVSGVNQRACELLERVFKEYLNAPSQLGRTSAKRVKKDGLHRTVCDFVSGMTDRYLINEHERLFGTGL